MISDLNAEPITGSFYEKELQKTSQEKFRIEKIMKRKSDKLYIKWNGYDNSFNSWINEKDLVKKWVNTFLSRLEILEEILMWNLIFQIMQQKLTYDSTSSFALKTNLASLKTEVDKLDIDKLVPVRLTWVNWVMLLKMMLLKKLCMIN